MLLYKADRRTLAVVGLYFTATTLAWIYFPASWLLRIPIILFLCYLSFTCAVIVHNTIHHPIFKSKILNKIFQILLSFTYGHAVSAYVAGHNFSHHHYQQQTKDRIRTTQLKFKWNFLNQLLLFFMILPGIVQDENIFAKKMYQEKPNWFWQYVFELVFALGVKFSLLLFVDWRLAILLLFIPHLYAAWGIVGTNYWQHDGCDRNDPNNHSRNFEGKFLNYIAFNNGFHAAHHDAPHLHWSVLPAYHFEHIKPKTHPNLCLDNLFSYLWKTCIYPGKRLDYLGKPVVLTDEKYEDWIHFAEIEKHKNQLGVES